MAGRPPKPHIVRQREGDTGHSGAARQGFEHPNALPEKPIDLSDEAGVIWDEYCRFASPGLLRLLHSRALGQLCEDKVLEYRLRRSLNLLEESIARKLEAALTAAAEKGVIQDTRDALPGGTLAAIAQSEDGKRLFSVLNQVIIRVQRQEQQFGLTPYASNKVNISESGKLSEDFDDELCG